VPRAVLRPRSSAAPRPGTRAQRANHPRRGSSPGRSGSAAALSAAQLVGGSVELAVVAPARARRLPHWPGAPAAVALLALGPLGTGVAFVLNLGVVRPRDRPSPRR